MIAARMNSIDNACTLGVVLSVCAISIKTTTIKG
jgi:hypothetical protein